MLTLAQHSECVHGTSLMVNDCWGHLVNFRQDAIMSL